MSCTSFFVMNYKGLAVLRGVVEHFGTDFIDTVVTARDKNVEHDYCKEIMAFCRENKLNCYLKDEKYKVRTKFVFAIGWRWIIPDDKFSIIVLHDSLLPKYRGFNPLVTSLINGDKQIGVTALFATEKYDCGPVIDQYKIRVTYPLKVQAAIELIATGYSELVNKICTRIKDGRSVKGKKQDEELASYSLWRDEDDYRIDWNQDAKMIGRFVNAVGFPYKGAFSEIDGQLVRISEVREVKDLKIENRAPGKVIFFEDKFPVVVCKKGLLSIRSMHTDDGKAFQLKKFRTRFV